MLKFSSFAKSFGGAYDNEKILTSVPDGDCQAPQNAVEARG